MLAKNLCFLLVYQKNADTVRVAEEELKAVLHFMDHEVVKKKKSFVNEHVTEVCKDAHRVYVSGQDLHLLLAGWSGLQMYYIKKSPIEYLSHSHTRGKIVFNSQICLALKLMTHQLNFCHQFLVNLIYVGLKSSN